MSAAVLFVMLFVIALFAGGKVLPIMLLILLIAAAGWGVAELRARRDRTASGPDRPA